MRAVNLVFATKCASTGPRPARLQWSAGARAQFIIKTLHTPSEETAPPFPDGRFGPPQTVGDLGIADAFCRPEDDFGPRYQGVGNDRDRARLESCTHSSSLRANSVLGRPMGISRASHVCPCNVRKLRRSVHLLPYAVKM